MFEFPIDACVMTRVGQFTYMVQPLDGVSPQQVFEYVPGVGAFLEGVPFGLDGWLGLCDLEYLCPVVGSQHEYDSIRFELDLV